MTPAALRVDELERSLSRSLPGARVVVHETLDSTIDACRAEADRGAPEGLAVLALSQRRGRGTHGHSWHSPPGGLHLSLLLRPPLEASRAHALRQAAGVAACLAARARVGDRVRVKEPNDLVVADAGADLGWRKLGGVVLDCAVQGAELRHAIVSVGLNVNAGRAAAPEELRAFVTSLSDETGSDHDLTDVARDVLTGLATARAALDARGADAWSDDLAERWSELACATPGFVLPSWAAPVSP